MRSDLNKQLCEHERYDSKDHYKNYRNLKKFNSRPGDDGQNLPYRESMKIRYGWDRKTFGENLNPLYGAVRKATGRPWNKFYSELCQIFDKRSVINQHILQHLYSYVERNIFIGDDGELWVRNPYTTHLLKDSGTEFYVDPRDGILKRNKWYKSYKHNRREQELKRQREKDAVERWIDNDTVLRFIEGVWYVFEMKPIPKGRIVYEKPWHTDVFKIGYSMLGKGQVLKTWAEMNEDERKRFGTPKLEGVSVVDVFTQETVTATRSGSYSLSGRFGSLSVHKYGNKYHATKRTASHKLLKKAGIV